MKRTKRNVYISSDLGTDSARKATLEFVSEVERLGYVVVNKELIDKSFGNVSLLDSLDALKSAEMVVVNIGDGRSQSVNIDIGLVAGWNEALIETCRGIPKKILGYSDYYEALQPKTVYNEEYDATFAMGGMSHKILDAVIKWGGLVGDKDKILKELSKNHALVIVKELDDMLEKDNSNRTDEGVDVNGNMFTVEMEELCGNLINASIDETGIIKIGDMVLTSDMYDFVEDEDDAAIRKL